MQAFGAAVRRLAAPLSCEPVLLYIAAKRFRYSEDSGVGFRVHGIGFQLGIAGVEDLHLGSMHRL